jgi:hypothetical protein
MAENSEKDMVIRGVEGEAWENGNFREICMGRIAPGLLYRSAHPVYLITRAEKPVITRAAVAAGIATVLNLSDSPLEIARNAEFTPWYSAVIQAGGALALGMGFGIVSESFCAKVAAAVRFMLEHPAPYLIHCFAGVDRTGFLAILFEGFMGADFFDVIDDYLISIYGDPLPPRSSRKYKRETVYVRSILDAMHDGREVTPANLRDAVIGYLKDNAGLRDPELAALEETLMGKPHDFPKGS